ncbi:MAG: hypothetical protein IPH45_21110 [Bacteroidales bacterium]|nr:hypothetical protein [Bacteroidales bacterium]
MDFTVKKPFKFTVIESTPEKVVRLMNAPKDIEITLQPLEGDQLVFHPTPGFTSDGPVRAQLSVQALIYNKSSKSVDLDKVILEYKIGSTTQKKEVYLPSDQMLIDPWYAGIWQNSREYHKPGDVIF